MLKIKKLPAPAPETLQQMLRRITNEAAVGLCAAGFEGIDQAARKFSAEGVKGIDQAAKTLKKAIISGIGRK